MIEDELIVMDALKQLEAELETQLGVVKNQSDRKNLIRQYICKVLETLPTRPAIEFPSQLEWPNLASEPLTLEGHLTGRVTLLDFFTYCCINCLHLLPDLEALEAEFSPTELLIVGVHSAKFDNERRSENIGDAALRYNIHHPVVNDPQASLWNRMEIICWPTILVLDPSGKPIKFFIGEGKREVIREFISVALETFRDMKLLTASKDSVPRLLSEDHIDSVDGRGNRILKYPGKVAFDEIGQRLFVSDSGHHRVIVVNPLTGKMLETIGDGVRGFRDGTLEMARFSSPQGVCYRYPDELYVCDTGNHAIRLVNLASGKVETLGGTGSRGNDLEGGGKVEQTLSSPWDLCLGYSPGMLSGEGDRQFDVVYIAMAGSHQIWAYALTDVKWWKGSSFTTGTFFRVAGNGAEENRNNSYPARAAFAQPSGITFHSESGIIYLADSESSSIRSVHLAENGAVKGVCGGSKNPVDLFSFGDSDGKGCEARLQHPLAVVATKRTTADGTSENVVVVADSYNHKLKIVSDLKSKNPNCSTLQLLAGSEASLNEPGGLASNNSGSLLFVSDTNNHAIKLINLESGEVKLVPILPADRSSPPKSSIVEDFVIGTSQGTITIKAKLIFPEGSKLNNEARSTWCVTLQDQNFETDEGKLSGQVESDDVIIQLSHGKSSEGETLSAEIHFNIFLCSSANQVCSLSRKLVQLKGSAKENEKSDAVLNIKIDLA